MKLEHAIKQVGHSCRQREFLRIAGDLGLSEPWTQSDADAIKAARRFNPGIAARKVMSGFLAEDFLRVAASIDLAGPKYTHDEIDQVRDAATRKFPGMTTEQMGTKLQVGVDWVRRKAREHSIGKKAAPGCYMLDGERVRRPTPSRYFVEADIQLLLDVLPDDAHTHPMRVEKEVYLIAEAVAEADSRDADAVLTEWVQEAAKAIVSS